jgi:hypothetical protein
MSSVTFSTTVGGDGSTVTDDDDATTGLRNGGWRTRFVPALTQEVAVAANAVASATAALSSKNAASTSATNAATSASNASTSATNAASSATAAAASYDSFDDRYLGAKTSDPTVDNDGNALLTGALYWNSATGVFKVWSGSAWTTNITSNQFGTNVATFLQTPTSANLAAALTDETGTGANVFASNPTFPAQINLTANSGYNIYASGTAPNYFGGNVGIGTGSILSQISLYNTRNITGNSEAYASYIQATVQTDVTSAGFGSRIALSAAAAASIPALYNIYINQGTFGAGSAVTNQYGVLVESTLTGATNNYGFYGNIAAAPGTSRYNLYMAGTADNYLAGSLGIGASLASSKLHVRSDVDALTILGQFQNRVSGANTGSVLAFINSANDTEDNRYSYIGAVTTGVGQNGNNLVFASNANGQAAVERMRIESSGNIGIGTASPNASAILDVQSTTKGVRMPNMTTTQKNAIASPAAGLMVFDTTLSKLCVYSGAAWQTITSI